jgi:hypothetical protein
MRVECAFVVFYLEEESSLVLVPQTPDQMLISDPLLYKFLIEACHQYNVYEAWCAPFGSSLETLF